MPEKNLIEHNLRLVVYIAKKFDNTGIGVEDLISIGTIGLIKSINTYNPDKNIKLATYASRCIENEILMYLRRTSKMKMEVSFDEPLNVDWDGNELLLSDILGTKRTLSIRIWRQSGEKTFESGQLRGFLPGSVISLNCDNGLTAGGKEYTQKEVRIRWESPSPIFLDLRKNS